MHCSVFEWWEPGITTSNTPKSIFFSFEATNPVEVQKHLKNINTKKITGFDKIPPKLVKLSAEILSIPLSIAEKQ